MPYAIAMTRLESTSPDSEDTRDLRRMAERVKRDHAMMRALIDDVERACVVLEERRHGSAERFRWAVRTLHDAFVEHLTTEEDCFAPLLRTVDAWGDLRTVSMMAEHDEQRRLVFELVRSAERAAKEPAGLVAQARALVASFRTDMDSEDRSLDDGGLTSPVVRDQEDG